jgi:probable F420-dependent oxidoreductase
LWVGGHVAPPIPTIETMVGLSRVAAYARRATVGSAIVILPLFPPAVLAKQFVDLDRWTDGRVVAGIGVGGDYPEEFRACGVPINERGRRTDEAIDVMRALFTGDAVTTPGPFYALDDVRLVPPPVQPGGPPIVVAGRSEAAMRRAATRGDGWMPYLYSARRYSASVATIRAAAAEAGRDLDGFQWIAYVNVCVRDDSATARADATAHLGGSYRARPDTDFSAMLDKVAVAGDPDEVAAGLRAFVDAGADHLIIQPCTHTDRLEMATRVLREVAPMVSA